MEEFFKTYLDYPLEVTIETTGRCNAHCTFCPHDQLERKNDYMSDELFMRIMKQLEEIPRTHRFYISPFKVNEFLMDRQIFERIHIINEMHPNALIRIFTNFNMATDEDIERLCQIKNLSDIDISLNSLDSEEYNTLMGIHLDRTLKNIHKLLAFIRENGITMVANKIVFSRVSQGEQSDLAYLTSFFEEFIDYLDMVEPRLIALQEWIDFIPVETPLNQEKPCARWADVNICCNGVVAFCCMDGRGAYSWGNVMDHTVLEIYNQREYRRLREECPMKSWVIPCRNCSQ